MLTLLGCIVTGGEASDLDADDDASRRDAALASVSFVMSTATTMEELGMVVIYTT